MEIRVGDHQFNFGLSDLDEEPKSGILIIWKDEQSRWSLDRTHKNYRSSDS